MFYFGENSIHTCQKYQAKGIPDHFKEGYVTNLLLYSLDEQLHHHRKSTPLEYRNRHIHLPFPVMYNSISMSELTEKMSHFN